MSFDDLAPVPHFTRKETQRKKVFSSYWMTSDVNYSIIKRIEKETAKKEEVKKEKEKVANEAIAKAKKQKAIEKRKARKHVIKKIKANPKL